MNCTFINHYDYFFQLAYEAIKVFILVALGYYVAKYEDERRKKEARE